MSFAERVGNALMNMFATHPFASIVLVLVLAVLSGYLARKNGD